MAYPPLEDDQPIPFGKHTGTKMIELPISYLMWALEKAEPGSPVNVYAKKNEQWIRAEGAGGKRNRPVRESGVDRNPPEPTKPAPPNKVTALEFICMELHLMMDEVDIEEPIVGMSPSAIAKLAERYKNYFNGTRNLTPLPKRDEPKREAMAGWGDESTGYIDQETTNSDDIPF